MHFFYIYTFVLTEKNCHCTVKSFVDCPEGVCVCVCVKPLVTSFPSKAVQSWMSVPFKGPVWEIFASEWIWCMQFADYTANCREALANHAARWDSAQRILTGSRVDESISSIKFLSSVDFFFFFFLTVWVSECVNIIYICIYEYCKCCFYMFSEWMTSHGERAGTTWPPHAFVKRDLAPGFS